MNDIQKSIQILTEMSPKNISNLKSDKLKEESQEYYNKNKSKFKQTNTKYLMKSGDNHNGYYMLVVDDIVEYFVKYQSKSYQKLLNGRMLRQVLVHRNDFSVDSSGIPKKVFFNHLLPTFGTIITDEEQTNDGKKFWVNAITESLEQPEKYSVYVLDKNKGSTIKIIDIEHFKSLTKNIWGDEECFRNVWVAISLNK